MGAQDGQRAGWGWRFDGLLLLLALATGSLLWLANGRVLGGGTVVELYQSAIEPQSAWQWLLHGLSPGAAVALMIGLSSLALWLFGRICLALGLGEKTTLALFLLLNFNPEYNDARLNVEGFQLVLPCFLLGLWGLLRAKRFPSALLALALPQWLASYFSPLLLLWNLLWPLALLTYPLGHWRRRLLGLLVYYLLAGLAVALSHDFPLLLQDLYSQTLENLHRTSGEMSIFFSADNSVHLSAAEALLLALVLVLINGIKIAGLLIGLLVVLAWRGSTVSVIGRPQRGLLLALLLLNSLLGAFLLLYTGYLFSDLVYMPSIMICLWLSASAAFGLLNRSYRPEQRLVLLWTFIAYALASIIVFGPSASHLKAAGQWAAAQRRTVYSNSREALFYAGGDPRQANFNIYFLPEVQLRPADLILYSHSRKSPEPEALELYEIEREFSNEHGDRVYALHLKDEPENR